MSPQALSYLLSREQKCQNIFIYTIFLGLFKFIYPPYHSVLNASALDTPERTVKEGKDALIVLKVRTLSRVKRLIAPQNVFTVRTITNQIPKTALNIGDKNKSRK